MLGAFNIFRPLEIQISYTRNRPNGWRLIAATEPSRAVEQRPRSFPHFLRSVVLCLGPVFGTNSFGRFREGRERIALCVSVSVVGVKTLSIVNQTTRANSFFCLGNRIFGIQKKGIKHKLRFQWLDVFVSETAVRIK